MSVKITSPADLNRLRDQVRTSLGFLHSYQDEGR